MRPRVIHRCRGADVSVRHVPGEGRGGASLVLSRADVIGCASFWLAHLFKRVIFYAMHQRMPLLFRDAGFMLATAALISALFSLGGVGTVLFGFLMDRFNANLVIAAGFALMALAIWAWGR